MPVRVAINGFGRIGRLVLRSIAEHGRRDIEVVAINDLGSVEANAHLFRYDSVHGRFPGSVTVAGDTIDIGDGPDQGHGDPRSGAARSPRPRRRCRPRMHRPVHQARPGRGAPRCRRQARVLVSAPCDGADRTVVYGVNQDSLTAADLVVSNGSCTTNCLATVARVLLDTCGIERGYMTTIHSYTGDQPTLDTLHADLYRARAAAMSMIPTSTGAAKALGLVLPELAGKLDGSSIRVPTPNVSVVDLKIVPSRDVTKEEINAAMEKAAAEGPLKGILAVTNEPLVSIDLNHSDASATVALPQTQIVGGRLARVLAWYDNEWGFSTRMADTAVAMAALG